MQQQNTVGTVAISGHRPFPFVAENEMYNVILIWHSPCAGDVRREMEKGNSEPLEWQRAVQWVHGLMEGIGRDWDRSKYVDAYIEPCTTPRPWTAEILNAFRRELARETLKGLDARIKGGQLEPVAVRETMDKFYTNIAGGGGDVYIP